jgi:hypothetical protein
MGSTSITRGEADIPTSLRAPTAPVSLARGRVAILESAAGGRVARLSPPTDGGIAILASSTDVYATTLGSGDLVRKGEA